MLLSDGLLGFLVKNLFHGVFPFRFCGFKILQLIVTRKATSANQADTLTRKESVIMNVLNDMNSRLKWLNIPIESFAEMLHRDVSTVKNTINPLKGNPTLKTLYEYASALGGEIVFMTPEAKQAMEDSNLSILNASVTQYAEQIEKLQGELENMAQRAEDKDKMIESLTLQVSRIAKQLDTKDEMINKLLNKYVLND